MQTGRTLQGKHIDAFGPYYFQISDYRKYEFLWHYLMGFQNYFSGNFAQIFILWCSFTLAAAQNHIYKESVTSERKSNMAVLLQNYFPMPQLTPDCDRIFVLVLPLSYSMNINALDVIRLIETMIVFRISEDYCRCEIYVEDIGDITFCHITKIIPSLLKNFELCDHVRSTYSFCVYKDNTA